MQKELSTRIADSAVLYRHFNDQFTDLGSYWYEPFELPSVSSNEKTGAQTLSKPTLLDGVMYPQEPRLNWFAYRKLLRDPTVALARCIMVAPMTLAKISVAFEANAPRDAEDLVEKEILTKKETVLKYGLEGCIDFGWIAFENCYRYDDATRRVRLAKMKPLLHQITYLRANPYTGDFAGIMQDNIITGYRIYLPKTKVQLFNIDQYGSDWYGNSILDNALRPAQSWDTVEKLSIDYMRKIAGAHWLIWYPVGFTTINGVDVDNSVTANEILKQLEANGAIAMPQDIEQYRNVIDSGTDKLWKIENVSDSGATSAAYLEILRYYDVQKVRAMMLPERMILEGEFGTKAEAVAHAEAAVAAMEMRLRGIIRQWNEQTVFQLLSLNYGRAYAECARLECAPITKDDSEFLKQIFSNLMQNPELGYAVAQGIDCDQIAKQLAIPQSENQEAVLQNIGEVLNRSQPETENHS